MWNVGNGENVQRDADFLGFEDRIDFTDLAGESFQNQPHFRRIVETYNNKTMA